MNRFEVGNVAFLLESNRIVREVVIVKATKDFYLVKFTDTDGAINVRESRLYKTREEVENKLNKSENSKGKVRTGYRPPHNIWL